MTNRRAVNSIVKQATLSVALILLFSCLAYHAEAQQKKRVIQLSGVIIGEDSTSGTGLPGVHVYVPKAGRGTTTNGVGFFSMPVLVGDSIVISYVGYEAQYYKVPANAPEYQTVIVPLVADTTYLKEVVVYDFPTEEVFKEAVLALNIPLDRNGAIDDKNFNSELLALMLKTTPMDGYQNQRYYLSQWSTSHGDHYMPVTNPFLNPFNWVKFFNSLKKKKK
ncbi:carboxypeptidase-like regulatory domain-containing protein [Pseudochryseolinea flava]|uniref:Carboxypeptidase-like regulatory domain-containing protein n=1 Tax=Pseudochryseolinea flava TaxID=2059302 RepID=A0A364Y1D8_9BACT|nr:carboxypeptidase-like regulatory domain-containing protein [Pseudochryseolinea flava]RAW00643.1 carboxypeptidase-like regulatory domain-containing protein [Pseudochryseolinea flava]